MLKLLMVGAGGIGGYYAARFLEAGHQVVLTARGAHLHALKRSGLTVHYEGRELVHMAAAHDHQELVTRYKSDEFDLIIITLKATATVSVVSELGDWLKQGRAPVLSLQNGVDNEPLLAKAVGAERVIGGLAVRIGGHIVRPGVIEAKGIGVCAAEVTFWQNRPKFFNIRKTDRNYLPPVFSRPGIAPPPQA